jgi:hypothetical protein
MGRAEILSDPRRKPIVDGKTKIIRYAPGHKRAATLLTQSPHRLTHRSARRDNFHPVHLEEIEH